jgi:DNA-binding LacI/PurR family transcriptional regulator
MPRRKSPAPPGVPPRVDIHAVAERANVSIATVSRTFNRVPTVNPTYAARVWAAIRELGYVPNTQARALVSGRSRLFGVIISDITNPFFPELVQGFEEEAIAANYEILLGSTAYDTRRMELCIDRMLQRKVDGVAVMTFGIETPMLERLAAQKVPLVCVDHAPDGEAMATVEVDYAAGIREAVRHLVVLGHTELAFISGPAMLRSAENRREAFLAALREHGLKPQKRFLHTGDHTLESGLLGMRSFFRGNGLPTAVLCSNDMTAIGVLHAAAEARLRIPQDLSVVGFDDIHIARFTVPPLTTIQMSRRELAHAAFRALQSWHEEGPVKWQRQFTVKTRLVLRQTTAAPPRRKVSARGKAAGPAQG